MKVRELGHWPPEPSQRYNQSQKTPFPDGAIIDSVVYCRGGWLTFVCRFEENLVFYDFEAKDEKIAEAIKRFLEANVGVRLSRIAEVGLPE